MQEEWKVKISNTIYQVQLKSDGQLNRFFNFLNFNTNSQYFPILQGLKHSGQVLMYLL